MALSKTGFFLSKAEILGVGVFSPLPILGDNNKRDENLLFGTFWTHVLSGLRWLQAGLKVA